MIRMPAGWRAAGLRLLPVTALGVAGFVARALWAGQDANWDLQNYHDYAAYALLDWRYGIDVGPGGFQSYFNPLPTLPAYLLRHALAPMPAAILLAAAQAVLVPLAWLLAGALLPRPPAGRTALRGHASLRGHMSLRAHLSLRALATLVGIGSAMTLSEIGTSFADLPLAGFTLGALTCLLRSDRAASPRGWLLAAGFLVGAGAGLKPTNAVAVVGLLAACLAVRPRAWTRPQARPRARCHARFRRSVPAGLGWVAGGAALGLLATGGIWAALMTVRYGNPVFPAFNGLFRAPSASFSSFADRRFVPHGIGALLAAPFAIAAGRHPTAELGFAEPRLALCLLLGLLSWRAGLAMRRVLLFLLAASASWLWLFAIERYALALEVVAGIAIVAMVPTLVRTLVPPRLQRRAALPAAAALALATLLCTRPPDWWHRPWADAFVARVPDALRSPATYVLVASPLGYWASLLPEGSRFLSALAGEAGIGQGGVLWRQLLDGVRHPAGGAIRVLGSDFPIDAAARAGLAGLGLAPAAPCVRMRSLWWVRTIVCGVEAVGPQAGGVAALAPGRPVSCDGTGAGWIYAGEGWTDAGPAGTPMSGPQARLLLRVAPPARALALDLRFAPASSRPVAAIDPPGRRTLCIAAAGIVTVTVRGGGVLEAMELREARAGECGA